MKNTQINYSETSLSFICVRKHLLKDISYFLYLIGDRIFLSTEPESQQPKYQVQVSLENKLIWNLDKERNITQFGFDYKGQIKYFVGQDKEFRQLKTALRNRMMFKDVSDFYQPMKLLGKGGSSKVYLVIDKDSKLDYASKCVEKRYLREDGGFQALFNEINIMADLKHESIVGMQELYEGENTFYLILEYLKGSSLHDMTARGTNLTWDQIKLIMWQIINGVSCMHSKGIMHRDLKPENIMFKDANSLNNLRIVDFGLATYQNVQTYPFPKCGTPGYVAPEIANLKDLTFKYDSICDMFSVGCIFYKLITHKDLFPGSDYHEILKLNKKCMLNLDCLSIYRTPQPAIDLIGQMLQSNPAMRISAQQALEHPFFIGTPMHERKLRFQSAKKKEPQNKLWHTQNFKVEKLQLPEIKTKKGKDDDIEDEKPQIKVPVLNSPRMVQYQQRRNLQLADNSPRGDVTLKKPGHYKKYSTQEFEPVSPDTKSPDSARGHPTLVINNPSILKQEQPGRKKQILTNFQKYQQQPIQELEDEQKHY